MSQSRSITIAYFARAIATIVSVLEAIILLVSFYRNGPDLRGEASTGVMPLFAWTLVSLSVLIFWGVISIVILVFYRNSNSSINNTNYKPKTIMFITDALYLGFVCVWTLLGIFPLSTYGIVDHFLISSILSLVDCIISGFVAFISIMVMSCYSPTYSLIDSPDGE